MTKTKTKNWKQYKPLIFQYKGNWIANWFSNMLPSSFYQEGFSLEFKTVEHFYQAMKTDNAFEFNLIASSKTPNIAKKMGKNVKDPFKHLLGKCDPFTNEILNSIEDVKLCVMKMGLWKKFQIQEWKDKLLATGDEMIIEWNNWNDKWWGVDSVTCKGENYLGLLLMEIREELKNGRKTNTL